MNVKSIVVDRHGDIRSGWRMLLFTTMLACVWFVVTMPLVSLRLITDFVLRFVGVLVVLGCSYVLTRFINRKPWTAIGLSVHPAAPYELGMGCLVGLLMMSGVFLVESLAGYIDLAWRGLSLWASVWLVVSACVYFLVAAIFEEVLFRGYLFQTLMQAVTFVPATAIMAVLFALAHSRNPHVTAWGVANVGLAGVWLSLAYLKTRSLWLPIGLHFSWNFSQTSLFSFPTSGVTHAGKELFSLSQGGPEWLTGGDFGPEGGALATVALICGTWYIVMSKSLTAPEGIVTLDSLEDVVGPALGATVDSPGEKT